MKSLLDLFIISYEDPFELWDKVREEVKGLNKFEIALNRNIKLENLNGANVVNFFSESVDKVNSPKLIQCVYINNLSISFVGSTSCSSTTDTNNPDNNTNLDNNSSNNPNPPKDNNPNNYKDNNNNNPNIHRDKKDIVVVYSGNISEYPYLCLLLLPCLHMREYKKRVKPRLKEFLGSIGRNGMNVDFLVVVVNVKGNTNFDLYNKIKFKLLKKNLRNHLFLLELSESGKQGEGGSEYAIENAEQFQRKLGSLLSISVNKRYLSILLRLNKRFLSSGLAGTAAHYENLCNLFQKLKMYLNIIIIYEILLTRSVVNNYSCNSCNNSNNKDNNSNKDDRKEDNNNNKVDNSSNNNKKEDNNNNIDYRKFALITNPIYSVTSFNLFAYARSVGLSELSLGPVHYRIYVISKQLLLLLNNFAQNGFEAGTLFLTVLLVFNFINFIFNFVSKVSSTSGSDKVNSGSLDSSGNNSTTTSTTTTTTTLEDKEKNWFLVVLVQLVYFVENQLKASLEPGEANLENSEEDEEVPPHSVSKSFKKRPLNRFRALFRQSRVRPGRPTEAVNSLELFLRAAYGLNLVSHNNIYKYISFIYLVLFKFVSRYNSYNNNNYNSDSYRGDKDNSYSGNKDNRLLNLENENEFNGYLNEVYQKCLLLSYSNSNSCNNYSCNNSTVDKDNEFELDQLLNKLKDYRASIVNKCVKYLLLGNLYNCGNVFESFHLRGLGASEILPKLEVKDKPKSVTSVQNYSNFNFFQCHLTPCKEYDHLYNSRSYSNNNNNGYKVSKDNNVNNYNKDKDNNGNNYNKDKDNKFNPNQLFENKDNNELKLFRNSLNYVHFTVVNVREDYFQDELFFKLESEHTELTVNHTEINIINIDNKILCNSTSSTSRNSSNINQDNNNSYSSNVDNCTINVDRLELPKFKNKLVLCVLVKGSTGQSQVSVGARKSSDHVGVEKCKLKASVLSGESCLLFSRVFTVSLSDVFEAKLSESGGHKFVHLNVLYEHFVKIHKIYLNNSIISSNTLLDHKSIYKIKYFHSPLTSTDLTNNFNNYKDNKDNNKDIVEIYYSLYRKHKLELKRMNVHSEKGELVHKVIISPKSDPTGLQEGKFDPNFGDERRDDEQKGEQNTENNNKIVNVNVNRDLRKIVVNNNVIDYVISIPSYGYVNRKVDVKIHLVSKEDVNVNYRVKNNDNWFVEGIVVNKNLCLEKNKTCNLFFRLIPLKFGHLLLPSVLFQDESLFLPTNYITIFPNNNVLV